MSKSSSRTDGVKFQVKLSMRTSAWILRRAEESGLPAADVVREYVEQGLYLFGVAHDDFARVVTAARKARLPVPEYVKNVLSRAAHELPAAAADVELPTQTLEEEKPAAKRRR